MPQPQQLPGPNADIWDWQMSGLCRGVDSSMFFHPDGERGRARAQREMRAKEMCRSCPVVTQCRSHALAVVVLGAASYLLIRVVRRTR